MEKEKGGRNESQERNPLSLALFCLYLSIFPTLLGSIKADHKGQNKGYFSFLIPGKKTILNLDLIIEVTLFQLCNLFQLFYYFLSSENNSILALTRNGTDLIQQNPLNKNVLSASYAPGTVQGIESLVVLTKNIIIRQTWTSAFPLEKLFIKSLYSKSSLNITDKLCDFRRNHA